MVTVCVAVVTMVHGEKGFAIKLKACFCKGFYEYRLGGPHRAAARL